MKNNILPPNLLTVNALLRLDRLLMCIRKKRRHKIDSCGALKKTKKIKDIIAMLAISLFWLSIYISHRI